MRLVPALMATERYLYTDHFKINKFYGWDDPSFLQVYPEMVKIAENAQEMLGRRQNP